MKRSTICLIIMAVLTSIDLFGVLILKWPGYIWGSVAVVLYMLLFLNFYFLFDND